MKKLFLLLLAVLMTAIFAGCAKNENKIPENPEIEEEPEIVLPDIEEEPVSDVFVSIWPDELPSGARPMLKDGNFNPKAFWLYDFPDATKYFLYVQYSISRPGGVDYQMEGTLRRKEDADVTEEEYRKFIELVKKAGYTENAEETETSYICEKYGVRITIEYGKEFTKYEANGKTAFIQTEDYQSIGINLRVIVPDYEMDLEEIKRLEYETWQKKRNMNGG